MPHQVVAHPSARTTKNGEHEERSVFLDLRSAKAGWYFLSTTREEDEASYYYPLQIQYLAALAGLQLDVRFTRCLLVVGFADI
jgi:hypothetical protein